MDFQSTDQWQWWDNECKQYPAKGRGVEYFPGRYSDGQIVDCLLYYGRDRSLSGILNHYPFDVTPEVRKGHCHIVVRPDQRRKGIATLLLNVAMKRFDIDLDKQDYLPDGREFIIKYKANRMKKRGAE